MSISRLVVGLFFILLGIVLIGVSFFADFWILVYGVPILIIGVVLLLNKKEDEIEQRKDLKKTKSLNKKKGNR